MTEISNDTLRIHSVNNLLKSGDIGAHYEVVFISVLFAGVVNVVIQVHHNALQLGIDLPSLPLFS